MDLTQLLAFTVQNDASDLHLSAGSPPIIRVHGSLKRLKAESLKSDDIRSLLYSIMTEEQRAVFEDKMDIDFAITLGEKSRFRVNAYNSRLGACAVFRVIPTVVPTMAELDLPPIMRRFAELEKGLVLVTGPTGSGKSTTLAAMINHINDTMPKHIITIEDPVEFFHKSKKSLINHREVGEDTSSFQSALKASLREDPDIIYVGELRDYETISLALTASETGHLVYGTLHANNASKTLDRIIDVFPPQDKSMIRTMLASSLQGVVSQKLLKRTDGTGRVAAFEILVGTNAVQNLIRENQIAQLYSMMQTGARFGMTTMQDSIEELIEAKIVTPEEGQKVLLKGSDEEAPDDGHVAASIGGARLSEAGQSLNVDNDKNRSSEQGDDEGDYSF